MGVTQGLIEVMLDEKEGDTVEFNLELMLRIFNILFQKAKKRQSQNSICESALGSVMKTAIIPTDSGRQSACSSATETGSEDEMPADDLSDDEKLEEKLKEGPVNDAQVQDIIELYSSVRDDSQRLNSQLLQLEDLLQNAFNVKIKQLSKGNPLTTT